MNTEKILMSEKLATGEAQSKLILVGEHAVVHGQPAIALPFPLIKAESIVEKMIGKIQIDSSLYKGPLDLAPKSLSGIVHTVKKTLDILKVPYRDLLIRIKSSIPPGKGLGSSASVAIAIIKSLFTFSNEKYTDEQLLQLVNISETFAHGAPSGIDPLTITSPSPIWYKKEQPIDYIKPESDFYFVVADSGQMADTKTAIHNVTEKMNIAPQLTNRKIERIGEITFQVREALERSNPLVLGTLLNDAQHELQAIGVSNDGLDKLIHFARKQGALGAKLTGGGNGGCIIALAQDEVHAQKLSKELKQFGAQSVWPFTLQSDHK